MSEQAGIDTAWIRRTIAALWLPVWFAAVSLPAIIDELRDPQYLFFDARLYLEATKAWLAGGDPWATSIAGFTFAAPPPTLIVLAPVAALPTDVGVAALAVAALVGALLSVRMLRLPWWWLLFPPLVQSMLSANIQALLIPLILSGGGAIAVLLKIYAGLPLLILGRWRALVVAAAVLVITAPILPWGSFIAQFPAITANLATQTGYDLPTPLLVALAPLSLLALWIVGRERAAWLSVAALWPSQQFYYGTLTMGARSAIVGAIVAIPIPGSGLIAVFALAAVEWRRGARPMWPRRGRGVPADPGPSER